jgi:hypothetical protein
MGDGAGMEDLGALISPSSLSLSPSPPLPSSLSSFLLPSLYPHPVTWSVQEEENPSDEEDAARMGAAVNDIFAEIDTMPASQQQ